MKGEITDQVTLAMKLSSLLPDYAYLSRLVLDWNTDIVGVLSRHSGHFRAAQGWPWCLLVEFKNLPPVRTSCPSLVGDTR